MSVINKFVIMGAGGFGREVFAWLSHFIENGMCSRAEDEQWEIAGFIDDDKKDLNCFGGFPKVLSKIDDFIPSDNVYVVCAIAAPRAKKVLTQKLIAKGAKFFTLVHPTAVIGPNVSIGRGSVICPFTVLSTDLNVGEFVTVNCGSTIGHDATVSDFCTLSPHSDVTGGVKLGEGVFLGSHAVVVPKVVIGDYAVVGASSVAIRKVAPGVTVFGVPAKRISG